jgi:threonyl-tRNA synthetase
MQDAVSFRLSKWDPKDKDKYIDDPKMWAKSEEALRNVLKNNKIKFTEAVGEAAFYGPKIDIQTKNVYGKEDTIITMQLDLALPQKFDLTYIDEKGERIMPYMVHRTSIGCYERTIAMLLERTAGHLPLWLAPVQVVIMGITNDQDDYVLELKKILGAQFRVNIDLRQEKIGLKLREAKLKKIPYIAVVGAKEQATRTISVDNEQITIEEFLRRLNEQSTPGR